MDFEALFRALVLSVTRYNVHCVKKLLSTVGRSARVVNGLDLNLHIHVI
jgi:hypothetical protein